MSEDCMRPHVETRSHEHAQSRALVIDMAVAKTVTWLAGGALAACIFLGMWIGTTVTTLNNKVSSLEENRSAWTGQFSAMQAVDNEQSRRISALEVAITGLGALRDQMDKGFNEMAKRLDRIEYGPK
jgi:outer membrane murein-binding lipoprotein Lpp